MINREDLKDYIDGEVERAMRATDPKARADLLRSANEAQKLADAQAKSVDPIPTDESWWTREHEVKITWWQLLVAIATPLATIGAAAMTLASSKAAANAQIECKKLELESKERMLKDIVRGSEFDAPDMASLKLTNELMK